MRLTLPLLAASAAALLALAGISAPPAALPAFPGAEGFGAETPGGRGGKVIAVTNLNDSGPGSLRAACETKGPRTVVFNLSGLIELQTPIRITEPFVTIAGQTAPGAGICLKRNGISIDTHDAVIRHIRSRPGDISGNEVDGLAVGGSSRNVVIDHCSVSWSVDENLSPSGNIAGVTVQWCFITESLNKSVHKKGPHGYGSLVRASGGVSLHHNLWASNSSRNPRPGDNYGRPPYPTIDVRNNVIYNPGGGNVIGETVTLNYAGNYLKPGPDTKLNDLFNPTEKYSIRAFIEGNIIEGMPSFSKWFSKPVEMAPTAAPAPPVTLSDPRRLLDTVLANGGANLPARDSVDRRVAEGVAKGTGRIINSQNEVGGWPGYPSSPAAPDTDGDGIPDAWEKQHRLNPADPADGARAGADGYSNLEIYLNSLFAPGAKPGGRR